MPEHKTPKFAVGQVVVWQSAKKSMPFRILKVIEDDGEYFYGFNRNNAIHESMVRALNETEIGASVAQPEADNLFPSGAIKTIFPEGATCLDAAEITVDAVLGSLCLTGPDYFELRSQMTLGVSNLLAIQREELRRSVTEASGSPSVAETTKGELQYELDLAKRLLEGDEDCQCLIHRLARNFVTVALRA